MLSLTAQVKNQTPKGFMNNINMLKGTATPKNEYFVIICTLVYFQIY